MTELKPCPFCGGEAKIVPKIFSARGISRGWLFGVYCSNCDIALPKTDYRLEIQLDDLGGIMLLDDERQEAIEAWNRRATDER